MLDRDEVIKGLEEMSDYFYAMYHKSEDRDEINMAKTMWDVAEDAIALLREQENPCASCQEWECDGCEFARR